MTSATRTPHRHLPGEAGLWIMIFVDLVLFALMFALASSDMRSQPEVFASGKSGLNMMIGVFNTIVLLTGSWAVAMGTRVVTDARAGANWIYAAALCGALFLALKFFEYGHLAEAGRSISDDAFHGWYFILTAYHGLHVAAASVLLIVIGNLMRKEGHVGEQLIEAGGCYWHLVDLLWIGIFLVLYLM